MLSAAAHQGTCSMCWTSVHIFSWHRHSAFQLLQQKGENTACGLMFILFVSTFFVFFFFFSVSSRIHGVTLEMKRECGEIEGATYGHKKWGKNISCVSFVNLVLPWPVNCLIEPNIWIILGGWNTIAWMYGVMRASSYPCRLSPNDRNNLTQFLAC